MQLVGCSTWNMEPLWEGEKGWVFHVERFSLGEADG